ncbi:hypothetical protein INR49_002220 [Caranx melampygus]|nr:hypothetical protein INR49_002220 [Caranx melampygus]
MTMSTTNNFRHVDDLFHTGATGKQEDNPNPKCEGASHVAGLRALISLHIKVSCNVPPCDSGGPRAQSDVMKWLLGKSSH